MDTHRSTLGAVATTLAIALFFPTPAVPHCDGMDGPVVKAAQEALARGDINLVLIWVRKKDEQEVRQAFQRTTAVRKLGAEARELADRHFFETLVRIHRAGEGAPYTGLKRSGRDLGPAIPLADEALASGELGPLVRLLTEETTSGLRERFHHAMKARDYPKADVEAGRKYVQAYVRFLHYAERAYETASQPAAGHFPDRHSPKRHGPERHGR